MTGVEQNQGYKRGTVWEPGPGYREVPGSIAMDLEFPPRPNQPVPAIAGPICNPDSPGPGVAQASGLNRRNVGHHPPEDAVKKNNGYESACAFYGNATSETGTPAAITAMPSTSPSDIMSGGSAVMTPAPTSIGQALCTYVGEEPPAVSTAYCSCQGAQTMPLTSIPGSAVPEASSCAYKNFPGTSADVSITNGLGPVTTDMADCLAGSRYAINGGDMTSVPGCVPQQAKATVQAGSSPVHVGTLTGTALYTSISSALESICPSVIQTTSAETCETGTITIKYIDYVDPVHGTLAQGELDVQVQSSSYNVTSLRDAMIQAAAPTAQNSANGSNCYDATCVVPGKRKRWGSAPFSSLPRRWLSLGDSERGAPGITDAENGLSRRNMIMPENTPEKMQLCNAAGFAGVQYYSPFWRTAENPGSTDQIDAEWKFKVGMDGLLQCVRFHCRTN